MEFSPAIMEKLVDILKPTEPEVLQGDDINCTAIEIISNRDTIENQSRSENTLPKTIEEYENLEATNAEQAGLGLGCGNRKTPEYSMKYQQSVTAEDLFLQIGPKTPASASCENLIVKVKLPGDKKENLDLSVDTKCVTICSSQFFLQLPLPHNINPDKSKANWNNNEEVLVLTLKLDREFDFVNF